MGGSAGQGRRWRLVVSGAGWAPLGTGLGRRPRGSAASSLCQHALTHPHACHPPPRRFARKLKKLTAEQGARFVSYDAASGTWKFEVEHFSKYGLLGSDGEDSDEDLGALGVRGRSGAGAGQGRPQQQQQQQQQQQRLGQDGDEEGAAYAEGAADAEEMMAAAEEAAALLEEEAGEEEAMQDSKLAAACGPAAA